MKHWNKFVVLIVSVGVFLSCTTMGPLPEAQSALRSDGRVRVVQSQFWAFEPLSVPLPIKDAAPALIIYPGAKVDPRSYAPLARSIAEAGYLVAIVPVALSFAIFSPNRADWVVRAYPEVKQWVVAGHSLGGVAAAQYAVSHKDTIRGVVFWASYPAQDISASGIRSLSISADQDGLATPGKVETYKKNLPPNTEYVVIQGGNHAQFGWYGAQKGDRPAYISAADQTSQIAARTVQFLSSLSSTQE